MRYVTLIDRDGFRPNVGIILCNDQRRLFWGRRIGQNAWQFPQGGIKSDETPLEAMYRELEEEVGLRAQQVSVLGCTRGWLRYRLPKRFIRRHCGPICIGQKQVWYLLRVTCEEGDFCLDRSAKPEFDAWRWVRYWYPLREVVYFKRRVYEQALQELAPLLYPDAVPLPRPLDAPGAGLGSAMGSASGAGAAAAATPGLATGPTPGPASGPASEPAQPDACRLGYLRQRRR